MSLTLGENPQSAELTAPLQGSQEGGHAAVEAICFMGKSVKLMTLEQCSPLQSHKVFCTI